MAAQFYGTDQPNQYGGYGDTYGPPAPKPLTSDDVYQMNLKSGGLNIGQPPPANPNAGVGQRFYGMPGYDQNGQLQSQQGGGGYSNANAGSGPMQATGGGDVGGANIVGNQAFGAKTISQTANPNNQNNALLQSLMTQAQSDYQNRMKQYQTLLSSITGSKGLLSQLGKTGETRIAMNEQNQLGKNAQDLTSRGLGNSTIRSSTNGGIQRNAEMERQSLNEGIAGQKIGAQTQLFGMNPAPGMDTYLNMLTKLGGTAGSGTPSGTTVHV